MHGIHRQDACETPPAHRRDAYATALHHTAVTPGVIKSGIGNLYLNPNGVATFSPGLRGTSYPGFRLAHDKNRNAVPPRVTVDDVRGGTPSAFIALRKPTQGRRSFLAPTLGCETQPRWGSFRSPTLSACDSTFNHAPETVAPI